MSYFCPQCATGSVEVVCSLELPPDSWWDEIALQAIACARCDFRGLAVYEESRRGALDSEVVNHRGHWVAPETLSAFIEGVAVCPAPGDRACGCVNHEKWGRSDASGRWLGVPESTGEFPLRRAYP